MGSTFEFDTVLATTLKAQGKLVHNTPEMDQALANQTKEGLPPIQITPAQGQFLAQLCHVANAKHILELGTLGGYSTIWLATATAGAHVTSIEFDAHHHAVARANTAHLANVDLRLGAALDVLPTLAAAKRVFDVVFIDADWDEQQRYFDWAVRLTRPGGLIYVDNVVRQVLEGETEATRWALIEQIRADERVTSTLVPTWNTDKKSFETGAIDGFLMAIVK